MIKLDFSTFIFLYVLFSVVGILILWVVLGYKRIKRPKAIEPDYIWKCTVCFNDYIDSRHEDLSVCPVCGSYNKRENFGDTNVLNGRGGKLNDH
jgi:hypothetical protein